MDLVFEFQDRTPLPVIQEQAVMVQYQGNWFVRWNDLSRNEPLYIRLESGEVERLIKSGSKSDVRFNLAPKVAKKTETSAGEYTFGIVEKGEFKPLSPTLYIEPKHLTPQEYEEILTALKQICIRQGSASIRAVEFEAYSKDPNGLEVGTSEFSRRTFTAFSFADFAESVTRQAKVILEHPTQTMTLKQIHATRQQRISGHRQGRTSGRRAKESAQMIWRPTASFNTEQNIYLHFVLELIKRRSPLHIANLHDYRSLLLARKAPPKEWQKKGHFKVDEKRFQQQIDDVEELIQRIQTQASITKLLLRNEVMRSLKLKRPRLPKSSPQISTSKRYGPIVRAYGRYKKSDQFTLIPNKNSPLKLLDRRGIAPTFELYENWIKLAIYQKLLDFGFDSVKEGDSPYLHIRLNEKGTLSLPENLSLEMASHYRRGLKVIVRFEPEMKLPRNPNRHFQPDILLEFFQNEQPLGKFPLDAKYRNYSDMPDGKCDPDHSQLYGSAFDTDLLYTARFKYQELLQTQAAFILHSDSRKTYEFWGSTKYTRAHPGMNHNQEYPGHRYGAISVKPGTKGEQNLEDLLRCILMFHLNITNICWRCGKTVQGVNVQYRDREGKLRDGNGTLYHCDCSRDSFWVVSYCEGKNSQKLNHPLIKWGSRSFHATDPNDLWKCICPQCGDEATWVKGS